MPIVCGVDSSTQSTKVELRDADTGVLVADGRAAHPPTWPPRSEQDPDAWWAALHQALRAAGDVHYDAIAVAGQQHGMVVLDAHRRVVRPAKLWNDIESAPDAEWLRRQHAGGSGGWAEACGSVPVASFTITKLAWLHRSEPAAFERMAHVLLPHDWLTFRLTGELATDRGDASGTGYWSAASEQYRFELLDLVDESKDWPSVVPRVLAPVDAMPHLERPGTVVAPGTGDNMAAALGLGLGPGDVAISLGTSGTVFAVSHRPTADATGTVAGFADATGRYLPLVCTLNATKVTDTVARLLGVDQVGLDQLAHAGEAGGGGLTLVPHFDGERTPDRPDATGTLTGLRTDASREQVARAAYEGVVCGLLDGFDALTAAGVTTSGRLFLVGGGARSSTYRRVVADLTGRAVSIPAGTELVALGACVQGAAVLHGTPPEEVARAWTHGRDTTIEPDPAVDHAAIRRRYAAARG